MNKPDESKIPPSMSTDKAKQSIPEDNITDRILAKEAYAALFTGNPPEVCLLGLSPTTSTTMMTVIGDVLVVGTMKSIGFTNEDYAKRHHGGYLGMKSREISGKD